MDSLLYVNDGAFLTELREEAKATAQKIYTHFAHFGLQMNMGSPNKKSKMEAVYFPPSMKEAREQNELPPDLKLNNGDNNIHFSSSFKYLGSYITSDLSDELEIEVRIKKATAQMGMLKDFFMCRDVG